MESWFTHSLTALASLVAGAVLPFLLKWRKGTTDNWQLLSEQWASDRTILHARINALEAKVETIQAEHVKCLETQGELRAKVAVLEAQSYGGNGEH